MSIQAVVKQNESKFCCPLQRTQSGESIYIRNATTTTKKVLHLKNKTIKIYASCMFNGCYSTYTTMFLWAAA